MRSTPALAAELSLAMLVGCELVREPTALVVPDHVVEVHSMLVAGESRATLLLTRTLQVNGGEVRVRGVPGAEVRVNGGGQVVSLRNATSVEDCVEDFDSFTHGRLEGGCYVGAVEGGVAPGARYDLRIDLPAGGTVTGAVEVPEPLIIRSPGPGATLEFQPWPAQASVTPRLTLRWTRRSDARVILSVDTGLPECVATLHLDGSNDDLDTQLDLTGRDSAEVRGGTLFSHLGPFGSGRCRLGELPIELDGALLLVVFDTEYSRHPPLAFASSAVRSADAAIGVVGGLGVFAASAMTRIPVRLLLR